MIVIITMTIYNPFVGKSAIKSRIPKLSPRKTKKLFSIKFNEMAMLKQFIRNSEYCDPYEITENDLNIILNKNENFSVEFLVEEYKRITNQLFLYTSYSKSINIIDSEIIKNRFASIGVFDTDLYSKYFSDIDCLQYNVSILTLLKNILNSISNENNQRVIYLLNTPRVAIDNLFKFNIKSLNKKESIQNFLNYYEIKYENYKNINCSMDNLTILELYEELNNEKFSNIENNIIFNCEYCYIVIKLLQFIIFHY